jgi:DNA repair exonuclease SbcCD nuclease subunit
MKILHIADTHLGYSAYRKTTEEGINQREIDVYNAFENFINYALETKPDLIIHAGDLFDSVRPNNRAITFAIKQILRLSKQKIPFLVIAGNHEHPKLKETGHIFSVLDHIEHVYPIYNAKYETKMFNFNQKKVSIQMIPQCGIKKEFDEELKKIKPNPSADYNIFVTHGAVAGIKVFTMNEFNELMVPVKALSQNFDYIALGHFHNYTKLANNVFYPGSTEHFTFTDANDKKGFIELNFDNGKTKHEFIQLKIRPMIDLKPIECMNLKLDEIMKKMKETIKNINPKNKIFRIKLNEIPSHIYRGLDFREIKKLSNEAIHYEIKVNVIKEGEKNTIITSKIDSLTNEYKEFIENQDLKEKNTILKLGLNYIEKIESINEDK